MGIGGSISKYLKLDHNQVFYLKLGGTKMHKGHWGGGRGGRGGLDLFHNGHFVSNIFLPKVRPKVWFLSENLTRIGLDFF